MRTAMNEGNFGTPMNEAKKKIADSKNLLFEQVKYQKATEKDTNQAEGKLRKVIHSLQPFTVRIYPFRYKPHHVQDLAAFLASEIQSRNCPKTSEIYTIPP